MNTQNKIQKIVLVWNADFSIAGGISALKEVLSGQHNCSLCAIAYHRIRQTEEWTEYKKILQQTLGAQIRQPCRNQLNKKERIAAMADYPTVLAYTKNGIQKLLSAQDIDACLGDFNLFKHKLDAAIELV